MTTITQVAHEKFTNLRKRLDQLGYKQPLGLDSLPLVERLFCDLVFTTENLRKTKSELSSQLHVRSKIEDYVAPYKADNGKLIRENNEMHQHMMTLRQDYEEKIRGLKTEYRRLENENEDLKYFNSQCLDKINKYEQEAKRMLDQILLLQEKNFQAVVYTPGGQKKQLPFRRQRMDIDSLVPPQKNTDEKENYCCSVARYWNEVDQNFQSKNVDLLELSTKRCEQLEKQLNNLEEELDLSDKKVENFRRQVVLRDAEIERLRNLSESGRPLEAVLYDSVEKQSDRLIQQLQIQVDLLQTRNEELESRVLDLVNREIPEPKPSPVSDNLKLQSVGSQTCDFEKFSLINSGCQTLPINNNKELTSQSRPNKEIWELIRKFEVGRECLLNFIDDLVIRERDFINGLITYENFTQINTEKFHKGNQNLDKFIQSLHNHLNDIENNRNKWCNETKNLCEILKYFSNSNSLRISNTNENSNDNFQSMNRSSVLSKNKNLIIRRSKSVEIPRNNYSDCQAVQSELRSVELERDSIRDQLDKMKFQNFSRANRLFNQKIGSRESINDEIKRLRQEKTDLTSLLDRFERQLHDIQGNVRVLTQERNRLIQELMQSKRDLFETRKQLLDNSIKTDQSFHVRNSSHSNNILPSNYNGSFVTHKSFNNCGSNKPNISQTMFDQLEKERNQTAEDLRLMATERDSLREQLYILTGKNLNEKAHLLQRIEEHEKELNTIKYSHKMLEKRLNEMTKTMIELETERNNLLSKLNCVDNNDVNRVKVLETEKNLQSVQLQFEKTQSDYEKLKNECNHLHLTIHQLDQEKDHIQTSLDERTERCVTLERECAKHEVQLHDYQRKNETLEQRVIRLTQSIVERENECRETSERLAQIDSELKCMIRTKDSFASQLEQSKSDVGTMIEESKRFQIELTNAIEKQNELKSKLRESEIQLTQLNDLNQCKEQERNNLLEQYRSLTIELDEKTARVIRLENQLNDANHKIAINEQELINLRHHSEISKKECLQYKQVIGTLETQCGLLTRTASESEERVKRLQIENEELCHDLAESRSLCDRLEQQAHNAQHQLTVGSLESGQLKASLAETERELSDLRKQIDHERASVRNLELVLGTSRDSEYKTQLELRELRDELHCLRERLTTRETRILEIECENQKLHKYLSEQNQLVGSVSNSLYANQPYACSIRSSLTNLPQFSKISINCDNHNNNNEDMIPTPTSSVELPIDTSFTLPINLSQPQSKVGFVQKQQLNITTNIVNSILTTNSPIFSNSKYESNNLNNIINIDDNHNDTIKNLNISNNDDIAKTSIRIRCTHGCYHSIDCFKQPFKLDNTIPYNNNNDNNNTIPSNNYSCEHQCVHSKNCTYLNLVNNPSQSLINSSSNNCANSSNDDNNNHASFMKSNLIPQLSSPSSVDKSFMISSVINITNHSNHDKSHKICLNKSCTSSSCCCCSDSNDLTKHTINTSAISTILPESSISIGHNLRYDQTEISESLPIE